MIRTLFLLACFCSSLVSATTEIPDETKIPILTPSYKERKTAKIRLDNGIEAYLISDPKAPKSAAVMCVHVGSWDDPDDVPGMAHFTEHMLFLGTEEFPEESGFQRFITQHGGQHNAHTAPEATCFLFSVDTSAYPEALKRFASFFNAPLFSLSGTQRELTAIDQEFALRTQDETVRVYSVMRDVGNPKHPFHRFVEGNRESLGKVPVDRMRDWYKAHYSANLMRLVVYSPLGIDQLRNMVESDFSGIPNTQKPWIPSQEPLAGPTMEGKMAIVQSIKQERSLVLFWELPAALVEDRNYRPEDIVAYVLGYEGPKSILNSLKQEQLADSLSSGGGRLGGKNYIFSLQLGLTEKGLKNVDTVVQRVFEGIQAFRKTGVPKYLFDDVARIAELRYQYQQRGEPFTMMDEYASLIFDENLSTYPELGLTYRKFDAKKVEEVLAQLTPERVFLVLNTDLKAIGVQPNQREKWMAIDYTVQPISNSLMQKLKKATAPPTLGIPEANRWIPTQLTLVDKTPPPSKFEMPQPKSLIQEPAGQVYYAVDHEYEVPNVYWGFEILTPEVNRGDAKKTVLADLYVNSVVRDLNPLSYDAKMAGLDFALTRANYGVELVIYGYSEKASDLLKEIAARLKKIKVTPDEFASLRNTLEVSYRNATIAPPLTQAVDAAKEILFSDYTSNQQKVEAIQTVTLQDLNKYVADLYQKYYIEGMLYGDLTEEQAKAAYNLLKDALKGDPWPKAEQPKLEVISLPNQEQPHALQTNIQQPNDALILMIQDGDFSFTSSVAMQILGKALETPFYETLRTQQQTAYALFSWQQEIERQLFLFFALESSNYRAQTLLGRFELFLETFLRNFRATFPQAEFEAVKQALIIDWTKAPNNLQTMGVLLQQMAFDYDAQWDWRKKSAEAIKALSYDQFVQMAEDVLTRQNRKRFAILIRGQVGREIPLEYQESKDSQKLKNELQYAPRPG